MIKLENVNKYFNYHKKNEIHVINDANYVFPNKGLVAILGPSGSGKTTFLNTISGLDKVNKGNIFVNGINITKKSVSKVDEIRNLNIGYIFQDYKLLDNMTVFDNVALSLKLIGIKDEEEIKKRVIYTLKSVGMERFKNRPAGMLSGGERQRVGIARAIVKNPKIIIADEPTGNLDSKNSLEVMNIIKSISSLYLVILVTHEEDLAKFYASHIIELKDGKIIKSYENNHDKTLNYEIENNIYLKDFNNIEEIQKDNILINVYRNNDENIKLNIVIKNGNIYIEGKTNEKLEIIDSNSNINLIDDHHKLIDKNNIKAKDFKIEEVANLSLKEKYSSIFSPFTFISYGFKKILDYPLLKKILLGGFFLSGMFIFYAIASIFATINISDKDFININKNYLTVNIKNLDVGDFLEYEKLNDINYILPSDSIVNFRFDYDKYLQSMNNIAYITGSLSSNKMINSSDLLLGRMPNKSNEIVIDKLAIEKTIQNNNTKEAGFNSINDFLNHEIYVNNMDKFIIVGITDLDELNIYADESLFIDIIANSYSLNYYDVNNDYLNYDLIKNDIKLIDGKLPINDYEVALNINYSYYKIGDELENKINNKKLKIVGFYESNDDEFNYMLVNENMIKYNLIENTLNLSIYSKDKDDTLNYFHNKHLNIKDSYLYSKELYINSIKDNIISSLIVSTVILIVSLVEILLMIRSSFLSRIREVGIYRAIGIKKSDIYKMFSGEIIAISCTASLLGISFMTYILYSFKNVPYISNLFMVNFFTYILSFVLVFIFNLIVGLLPVYNTIRKTPAQILARVDVD